MLFFNQRQRRFPIARDRDASIDSSPPKLLYTPYMIAIPGPLSPNGHFGGKARKSGVKEGYGPRPVICSSAMVVRHPWWCGVVGEEDAEVLQMTGAPPFRTGDPPPPLLSLVCYRVG